MNTLSSIKSNTYGKMGKKRGYDAIDPTNLFLYYPFDASTVNGNSVGNMATGSIVYDASLTDTTVITNNKMSTPSLFGTTNTNGTLIYKVIPCSSFTGLSFSFWFNVSSIPTSTYYFLTTIQDTLGYPSGNRIYITIDTANRVNINGSITTSAITLNTNYHLVFTITSGNSGKLYLNNVLQSAVVTYPSFVNSSGFNSIGRDPAGKGIIGTIDDYRLYTRILTASEVNTLYYL